MKFLCIYLGKGNGGGYNACIGMGTHSQSLLFYHFMDFDETWYG